MKLWVTLGLVVALVASSAGMYRLGYADGKRAALADVAQEAINRRAKTLREAEELRNEVDGLDDNDLRERVSDWLLDRGGASAD